MPFNQVLNFPDHLRNIVDRQKSLLKNSKLSLLSYFSGLPSGDILDDPELDAYLSGELFEEDFEYTVLDQSSIASTVRTEQGRAFMGASKAMPMPGFNRRSVLDPAPEEPADFPKASLSHREIKVPGKRKTMLQENSSTGYLTRGAYTKQLTQGSILVPDDVASVETTSPRPQLPRITVNNNIYVNTYEATKQSARLREAVVPANGTSIQHVIENPPSKGSDLHSPCEKPPETLDCLESRPCRPDQTQPSALDPIVASKKKTKKKKRVHDKSTAPEPEPVPAPGDSAANPNPALQSQPLDLAPKETRLRLPQRIRSRSENLASDNESVRQSPEAQQETPTLEPKALEESAVDCGGVSTHQDRDLSMISGINGADSPLLKSPLKKKATLQPIKPESRDILKSEIKLKTISKNFLPQHSKKESLNLKTELSIDLKLLARQTGLVKANTQELSSSFVPMQHQIKSPKTLSGLKQMDLSNRLLGPVSQYLKQMDSPLKSSEKPNTTGEKEQLLKQVPTSNIEAMQMVLKKTDKIHSAKLMKDNTEDLSLSKADLRQSRDRSALDEPVRKKQTSALQRSSIVYSKPDPIQTLASSTKREAAKKSAKPDSSNSIKPETKKTPASSLNKVNTAQNDSNMALIFTNKLNPAGSKVYSSATAVSAYSGTKASPSITKMTSVRNDSSIHRNHKPPSRIADSKATSMCKRVTQPELIRGRSTAGALDPKRFAQASDNVCKGLNLWHQEKKPVISIYDYKNTREVPELAFRESQIADLKLSKTSIASKLQQDNNLFSKSAYRSNAARGSSRTEVTNFNSNLDLSIQEQTQHLNREKSPAIGLRVERTKYASVEAPGLKRPGFVEPHPASQVLRQSASDALKNRLARRVIPDSDQACSYRGQGIIQNPALRSRRLDQRKP